MSLRGRAMASMCEAPILIPSTKKKGGWGVSPTDESTCCASMRISVQMSRTHVKGKAQSSVLVPVGAGRGVSEEEGRK